MTQQTDSQKLVALKPSAAFIMMAWAAMALGSAAFLLGLYNADMQLNEKGYYLITLMFGLYSAVSVQKSVRDREEGLETSPMYFGLSWLAFASAVALLGVGLWNAELWLSEKGFFAMAYILALFGSITIQKNVRDLAVAKTAIDPEPSMIENRQKPDFLTP